MARRRTGWTCQRTTAGVKCRTKNPSRARKCRKCGKPRPARKQPAHMAILDKPYEWWVEQFGERCGICGCGPSPGRRLDRDHDHASGVARGLLCHRHNRGLDWFRGRDELVAALAYLDKSNPQVEVQARAQGVVEP